MKEQSKLPFWGSMLTLVAFVYLLIVLAFWKAVPLNPATWCLWTVLDIAIAVSIPRGNQMRTIMTAFACGAGLLAVAAIVQIVIGRTHWTWELGETLTLIAFIVTMLFRSMCASQTLILNVGATAMFIAGTPTWIDAWVNPTVQDPIFWGTCAIGWLLTLIGTPRSFEKWYMPMGGLILNAYVAVLAMGVKNWIFISVY